MSGHQLFWLFFFLTPSFVFGQNLIPNPSFETVNTCQKYQEACSPKAWRSTLLKGFVYGEYLGDRDPDAIIPPDGNRYIALRMYNRGRSSDRTFIQVPLLCPLEAGTTYQLSFYYYTPVYAVEHFGVLLTDSLRIYRRNEDLIGQSPQIKFARAAQTKRQKWTKVEAKFTAKGHESVLLLGNFWPDEETLLIPLAKSSKGDLPNRAYYIFDQFELQALEKPNSPCDLQANLQFLYRDSTRHLHRPYFKTVNDIPTPEVAIQPTKIPKQSIAVPAPKETSLPIELPKNKVFTLPNIQFETNSDELLKQAYLPLKTLAEHLREHPQLKLNITGHTDNIGNKRVNQKLSEQRAASVARFLMKYGVEEHRLFPFGKGETAPIDDNQTEKGRQNNRRVEFSSF